MPRSSPCSAGPTPAAPATAGARLWAWLGLCGLLALSSARADAPAFAVEAAYIYRFTSYVEWPAGSFAKPDSPLVIGVLGDDDVAAQLERTVAGKSTEGHLLQVRRLQAGEPLSGLHFLVIGHVDSATLSAALAAAAGLPLVTVTESEADYAQGSMINLVTSDNRVRFEVALGPVEAAHLKISARMLTAALSVARRQP